MNRARARIRILIAGAMMLAGTGVGCAPRSPQLAPTLTPTAPTASVPPSPTVLASPAVAEASLQSNTSIPATKTPPPVRLTAKGNVFIRRGPDLAFNQISVLMAGEIAIPTGRDVLGRWLRIPLPKDASKAGWISIMTKFTQVEGDVRSLPEIAPTEWPQLAYLRNCTYDVMSLVPGGLVIPPIQNFPDNDVRVNPGSYVIVDLDVDGYPQVMEVEIREGSSIDILFDGYGQKKKCPLP